MKFHHFWPPLEKSLAASGKNPSDTLLYNVWLIMDNLVNHTALIRFDKRLK